MPIIYIHGVGTRDTDPYRRAVAVRDRLVRHYLADPLAEKSDRFRDLSIANPYWGRYGASVEEDDRDRAEEATRFSLLWLAEAALSRIAERSAAPPNDAEVDADEPDALLVAAVADVAAEASARDDTSVAAGRATVPEILETCVRSRYETLLVERARLAGTQTREWVANAPARVAGLFDRLREMPDWLAAQPLAEAVRAHVRDPAFRFLRDAYVYVKERGSPEAPGPIVQVVLDALRHTPRRSAGEATIVLTHSMGGNILYDVLTRFAPDLVVDAWVSVGGQVALFESLNALAPAVEGVRVPFAGAPALGVACWLNVYDPADPLAFRASQFFEDAEDIELRSGTGILRSHTSYFRRPRFYRTIESRIAAALV